MASQTGSIDLKGLKKAHDDSVETSSQYFWHTETDTGAGAGTHITEITQDDFMTDPANGGGNLLATSDSLKLRDGLIVLVDISQGGFDLNSYNQVGDVINLAHLGYALGKDASGNNVVAPYFSLGGRLGVIGNFSVVEGFSNEASGYASHAEGSMCSAGGSYAHANGYYTNAAKMGQTVIGICNIEDTGASTHPSLGNCGQYAFIIGNGDQFGDGPDNAFTVDWTGRVEAAHSHVLTLNDLEVENHTFSVSAISSGNGSGVKTVTFTKPGYYPLGIVGFQSGENDALFTRCKLDSQASGQAVMSYYIRAVAAVSATTGHVWILWAKE